jgi:Apea-like HEPN
MSACDGLTPSVAAWLVAAVLRLRIPTPIRLAVIGNMPFDRMGEHWQEEHAVAFESAPHQIGIFKAVRIEVTNDELSWLRDMFPVAARLYHDERFFRAFSVYDQAQWTPTPEMATVLVWTAIEILFDLAGEREKTKAICRALSDYVGVDQSDRDRAYQVIQDLYYKRGQTVHAGRGMASQDVIQSFRLANVAFQRVLVKSRLPPSRGEPAH